MIKFKKDSSFKTFLMIQYLDHQVPNHHNKCLRMILYGANRELHVCTDRGPTGVITGNIGKFWQAKYLFHGLFFFYNRSRYSVTLFPSLVKEFPQNTVYSTQYSTSTFFQFG